MSHFVEDREFLVQHHVELELFDLGLLDALDGNFDPCSLLCLVSAFVDGCSHSLAEFLIQVNLHSAY